MPPSCPTTTAPSSFAGLPPSWCCTPTAASRWRGSSSAGTPTTSRPTRRPSSVSADPRCDGVTVRPAQTRLAVLGWTLRRQHLAEGTSGDDILSVIEDLLGLHATMTLSSYLQLHARTTGFVA